MTKRPKHRNGYSKKELLEIIKEIDADRNQIKLKTEKQNADKRDNGSHFYGIRGEQINESNTA